jgi:hypothetical protein
LDRRIALNGSAIPIKPLEDDDITGSAIAGLILTH